MGSGLNAPIRFIGSQTIIMLPNPTVALKFEVLVTPGLSWRGVQRVWPMEPLLVCVAGSSQGALPPPPFSQSSIRAPQGGSCWRRRGGTRPYNILDLGPGVLAKDGATPGIVSEKIGGTQNA